MQGVWGVGRVGLGFWAGHQWGRHMRGILATGAHIPHRRLDRAEIPALLGKGGGRGTRAVASYDEDTTTMGVEAARRALASAAGATPESLWFATSTPAYLDKTNATAIHAALRLDPTVGALDFGGAIRSGIGALRTALAGRGTTLVVAADLRDGLPGSADESAGGDGASAVLVGDDTDGTVIAEYLGAGVATDEILERWRIPGARRSRTWEERFGEIAYTPLMSQALEVAIDASGVTIDDIDRMIVTGLHSRAVRRNTAGLGVATDRIVDDLSESIGNTGTAHPALLLTAVLDDAGPDAMIALMMLADGVEVILLRTTEAIVSHEPSDPVVEQIKAGGVVAYGRFLSWRGMLDVEPPNRPEPNRVSAAASHRRTKWKYGFVGSRDRSSGMIHMPPARISQKGGAVDDMEPVSMADTSGTVASFTIDRLVHSPSPPVVFAVVDFDGGGRVPLEMTDVDPGDVRVGDRVKPTFRRMYTSDEIHNYFWKVRPLRVGEPGGEH